jgi:hypothetical protein
MHDVPNPRTIKQVRALIDIPLLEPLADAGRERSASTGKECEPVGESVVNLH